jgi:hypothetical protein
MQLRRTVAGEVQKFMPMMIPWQEGGDARVGTSQTPLSAQLLTGIQF